jgi:hypothetical protein
VWGEFSQMVCQREQKDKRQADAAHKEGVPHGDQAKGA